MVRHENPLQSRRAQGYVIAHAYRSSYPPGGPDHVLNLSAPPCVAGPGGSGALCPPSAPAGVQLTVGVASRLWRTGHAESAGPAGPPASGLPALPPLAVCRLRVPEDVAVVVRRASPAGLAPARGWPPLSGRRPDAHRHTGLQASGRPQDAAQPVPA